MQCGDKDEIRRCGGLFPALGKLFAARVFGKWGLNPNGYPLPNARGEVRGLSAGHAFMTPVRRVGRVAPARGEDAIAKANSDRALVPLGGRKAQRLRVPRRGGVGGALGGGSPMRRALGLRRVLVQCGRLRRRATGFFSPALCAHQFLLSAQASSSRRARAQAHPAYWRGTLRRSDACALRGSETPVRGRASRPRRTETRRSCRLAVLPRFRRRQISFRITRWQ